MTPAERRAAWLAERRKAITGTDVPRILGLARYGSAMDVFLSKTAPEEEDSGTSEVQEWGLRLQSPILGAYADKTEQVVEAVDPYLFTRSATLPILGASLDGIVRDSRVPVDAKNVRWKTERWGESGTDEMPPEYAAQLVVELHVLRSRTPERPPDFADLAVLFSGSSFGIYRLHYDADAEAAILDAVDRFWRTFILRGVPPPVDGTKAWETYLKRRVKQASELVLEAVPEIDEWAERLRAAKEAQAKAEEAAMLAQNQICALIGENAGAKGAWGRISFKASKPRATVDKDALIEVLERIALARGVKPKAIANVRRKCTNTGASSRTFRPTFNSKPEE